MGTSIGPKIGIEGENEFRKAITHIRQEFRLLGSEMKLVASQFGKNEKSMDSYRAKNTALEGAIEKQRNQVGLLTSHLDTQKTKLEELKKALEETSKSHDEDSKEVIKAQNEYRRQTENVNRLETELNKTTVALNENERELKDNTKAIEGFGKEQIEAAKNTEEFKKAQEKLKENFDAVKKAAKVAGAAMVAALTGSAKAAIDYESAFAGVRKTVDATEEQFAGLSKGIREMSKDIPASATAIAEVAEAAGQLGIETDSILDFTRVMIDLGESSNLSSDQAATALARFANITQMSQKDFSRLGSTIVDLGNSLATTESEIVEMGLRLAGAGKQIGLTEAQTLAFAGALSSVGIEAQAGGSAFSKVMIDIQLAAETGSDRLNEFAKVAGMSASDFKKAFEKDAAGAIIEFIKGLSTAEERGMSAIKVLDDMGIKEVRLRDALLRAAGASDVFSDSVALGTKAWEENTALSKEAGERYKTVASQLKTLKNVVVDTGIKIGEEMVPTIKEWTARLKEVDTKPIVDGFKWIINNGGTIVSVAGAIGAGMLTWNVASTVQSVVSAVKAWKVATEGMTIAQSALNAVTAATPIGAMAVTIGAAVAAFGAMKIATRDTSGEMSGLTEAVKRDTAAWEELQKQQEEHLQTSLAEVDRTKELWTELQTLIGANGEVVESKERVKYITDEINKIAPDSIKWVDDETIAYQESAKAIDDLMEKKRAQIILESQEAIYKEALLKVGDKQAEQARFAIDLAEQERRAIEARSEAEEKGGLILAASARNQEGILADMQEEYAKNENILKNYYETIQAYEENSAAVASSNYEKIKEINANTVFSYQKAKEGTVEELEAIALEAEINALLMRQRFNDGTKGITEDMVKNAEEAAKKAKEEYRKVGGNIVDGAREGVESKQGGFVDAVRRMANAAVQAAKKALDIKSPSRVFAEIGGFMAEGMGMGFVDEMLNVKRQIKESVPTNIKMVGQYEATTKMGEGIVNGLAGIMPQQNQPTIIQIMLPNGKALAEVVFDPLTGIAKQKGVPTFG